MRRSSSFFQLSASTTAFVLLASIIGSACDLTKLTANSTSHMFERATPGFEEHWDYEMAMAAGPATIIQMEGLLRVVPENEIFLMQTLRAYIGYAFGHIEELMEEAEARGDYVEGERQSRRAKLMYRRSLDLGKHMMSLHAEGMEQAMEGGLETFQAWVNENFEDEEDADMLLWTGYAWGSYINQSKDDMAAVADLAFAKVLVQRSVELNDGLFDCAGLTLLAVIETTELAGDMDRARAMFEQVLARTERRSLLAIVALAKIWAVKRGDRALYVQLLREVLEAGDINPRNRLMTRIAKHKAARYLRQVNDLF